MRRALVGSVLIASLVANFQAAVLVNPALTDVSSELAATAEQNANFVTTDKVKAGAEQAGLAPEQVDAVVIEYPAAQIAALKAAFAAVVLATSAGQAFGSLAGNHDREPSYCSILGWSRSLDADHRRLHRCAAQPV